MARSRTLKPSFFTNEQLADLAPLTRLLFAGLWCLADRDGKLRDRPRKIRAELFPYDPGFDVDAALSNLAAAGLLLRYGSAVEINGEAAAEQGFIKILGFKKHQNPHPREPASEIPEPFNVTAEPWKETAEHGKAGTGPAHSSPPIPPSPIPSLPTTEAVAGVAAIPGWLAGIAERLSLELGRTLAIGKDPAVVVEAFQRRRDHLRAQGYEDPDATLRADCLEIAARSKNGTPGTLAFFVGWLNNATPKAREA